MDRALTAACRHYASPADNEATPARDSTPSCCCALITATSHRTSVRQSPATRDDKPSEERSHASHLKLAASLPYPMRPLVRYASAHDRMLRQLYTSAACLPLVPNRKPIATSRIDRSNPVETGSPSQSITTAYLMYIKGSNCTQTFRKRPTFLGMHSAKPPTRDAWPRRLETVLAGYASANLHPLEE